MLDDPVILDLTGGDDADGDMEMQRAIQLSLGITSASEAQGWEAHNAFGAELLDDDDLELQRRIEEAMQASVETVMEERSHKRGMGVAEPARSSQPDADMGMGARMGDTPCAHACRPATQSQAAAYEASTVLMGMRGGGASYSQPACSGGASEPRMGSTAKRACPGSFWDAPPPLVPGLVKSPLLRYIEDGGSDGDAQRRQTSRASSSGNGGAASCAGGAVCGGSLDRVPSPGVEQHSGTSALTAGGSLAGAGAAGDRAGDGPSTGSHGAASTRWQAPLALGAPAGAPQRRFYRGQDVYWRDDGATQSATVTFIDARSSPLLYTLALHPDPTGAAGFGGRTCVDATAYDMFPHLVPGLRVWCHLPAPDALDEAAAPAAVEDGAVHVEEEPQSCGAAETETTGAADGAAGADDGAALRGPAGGSGCGVAPGLARAVWHDATVVFCDLSPQVPDVWVSLRAPPGDEAVAATTPGHGAALTCVSIYDVELQYEVGESSSCTPALAW